MIFGSIGLLVVAGGLLAAGIIESSTGFLALSLASTAAAGLLLVLAYAAARGATGLNTGRAVAPAGVVYVPMQAVPAGAGNGAGTAVPLLGYDDMTAEQISKLISSGALTDQQLQAVRDYEKDHESRKTVLDRIERALR